MCDNLNLNINNYTLNELLNFFDCNLSNSIDTIKTNYEKKISTLINLPDKDMKNNLNIFFKDAYDNIILTKERNNKLKEESEKNIILDDSTGSYIPINNSNDKVNPQYIIEYPKNELNPIKRTITSEIICIDSIFRDKNKYPNSTDFVIEFPTPIENVTNIDIISAEIPKISNLFSTEKQNNEFNITMYNGFDYSGNELIFWKDERTLNIKFSDGSPDIPVLISTIQANLDTQRNSFSFIKIDIDTSSGRLYFRFKTLVECLQWNTMFYKENSINLNPNRVIPPDNKEPSNFFRMPFFDALTSPEYDELEFIYKGDEWARSNNPDLFNLFEKSDFLLRKGLLHPDNSVISFDLYNDSSKNSYTREPLGFSIDFNPNKCETEQSCGWILGFRQFINNDTFYKTGIINYKNECIRDNIKYIGYLEAITPFGDTDNTYNYIYVDDFVGNYKDSLNVFTEKSYLTRSILAKIQMDTSFFGIRYNGPMCNPREYFGPVNIKKLHIKVLDKFNNIVDYKKSNFSITFKLEKLYNYV